MGLAKNMNSGGEEKEGKPQRCSTFKQPEAFTKV
jgi:hypothetical protein